MNIKHYKLLLTSIIAITAGLLLGWIIFGGRAAEVQDHSAHEAGATEYTCSMHPQIRQNEPGKCPICGMDLIPVSKSTSTAANPFLHEMTPTAVALANIQTTTVKSISASNQLFLTGKVKVNEQQLSAITARFPGRIEKLMINFEGQEVRKGERIATIYSPELVTAQRELLEAKEMKSISPELYEAAKQKLRYWKITEQQIEKIEQNNEVFAELDVHADASGFVTSRQVSLGDYVSTGSIMFQVANLSTLWIVLDAYESDLAWIKNGSSITFSVPSIPGKEFAAKVNYINPVIDPATRAVGIRAVVANTGNLLKPEMLVNARIQTKLDIKGKAIAIPATAVLWTGKRSLVYVRQREASMPAFERREVTLGARMGDMYVVEKGLEEGDEVVSNGVFSVDASAQLSGNYSMMAAPETKSLDVPESFRQQLTALTEKYFELKNALVNSDVHAASLASTHILEALKKVDATTLDEKARDSWKMLQPQIAKGASEITKQNNIDDQRKSFELVSDHLIESVELFGQQNEKIYRAYCPMAFGDKGAFWLSEVEEIRNPYFGAAMLKCGENKAIYRKNEPVYKSKDESRKPDTQHVH